LRVSGTSTPTKLSGWRGSTRSATPHPQAGPRGAALRSPSRGAGRGGRETRQLGRRLHRPEGDGSMQEYLRVYQRAGEPCLRCGRPIRRIVVAAARRISARGASGCRAVPRGAERRAVPRGAERRAAPPDAERPIERIGAHAGPSSTAGVRSAGPGRRKSACVVSRPRARPRPPVERRPGPESSPTQPPEAQPTQPPEAQPTQPPEAQPTQPPPAAPTRPSEDPPDVDPATRRRLSRGRRLRDPGPRGCGHSRRRPNRPRRTQRRGQDDPAPAGFGPRRARQGRGRPQARPGPSPCCRRRPTSIPASSRHRA